MAAGQKTGGRKAGVPNKVQREDRKLARKFGPKAIEEIAALAGLSKGGVGKAEAEAVRLGALNTILDRAYGKAPQAIDGDGEGGPINVITEIVLRGVRSDADH